MPDSLTASIAKLRESTDRLNKLTDEAAQVVRSVEAFLNKECSIGVYGSVLVREEPIDPAHNIVESTYLVYTRYDGKFRIVVSTEINDPDTGTAKPWAECDRETKLDTIARLPELIEQIATTVDARVQNAEEATKSVAAVLAALDRKGGK